MKKTKKDKKDKHSRVMDNKWASLEKRGFERPKSGEENRRRAFEAHHGRT